MNLSIRTELSKKKKYLPVAAVLLVVLAILCFFLLFKDRLQFALLSKDLFHSELSGNTLTLHYTLAYPEDYGFEETAVLPCYTGASRHSETDSDISTENEDKKEILKTLSALSRISKEK